LLGWRPAGDLGSTVGGDDDSGGHQQHRGNLAEDVREAAAQAPPSQVTPSPTEMTGSAMVMIGPLL
jgi:hypothetical protein